jgi:hypothetical protein
MKNFLSSLGQNNLGGLRNDVGDLVDRCINDYLAAGPSEI